MLSPLSEPEALLGIGTEPLRMMTVAPWRDRKSVIVLPGSYA